MVESELKAEQVVEVRNSDGLHMRPAMEFVECANKFRSQISVGHQERTADAKSIMQVTMLAATCGTKLKISAAGEDADEAVKALVEVIDKAASETTA